MSLASLLVHNVTILTAGEGTNRYGDQPVKDWTDPATRTVKGWVSQRSGTEDNQFREAQVSTWVLYMHPDDTISPLERVRWESTTFEVDGPANPAWSPRGLHHYEVPLRVVDG